MTLFNGYALQFSNVTATGLADTGAELIITESALTSAGAPPTLTTAELGVLAAAGKIVVAYVNTSVTDAARSYWNPAWVTPTDPAEADVGTINAGAPDWLVNNLGGVDFAPEAPGQPAADEAIRVDYRNADWRALVVAQAVAQVQAGYGGVFLDDVAQYYAAGSRFTPFDRSLADSMMQLVIEVATAVRAINPDAKIIVNSGIFIGADSTAGTAGTLFAEYRAAIDGMIIENLFASEAAGPGSLTAALSAYPGISILALESLARGVDAGKLLEFAANHPGLLPYIVPDEAYDSFVRTPLVGTGGNDTLLGAAAFANLIGGGDGADSMTGGALADTIYGHTGGDTLRGAAGNDTQFGGAGNDRLSGGAGSDRLLGGTENDILTGEADADTLQGNSGNDALIGSTGSDLLVGDEGDDTLSGGTEADRLSGGAGRDSLFGGTENDTLTGDTDADTLQGNSGNDALIGGAGNDVLVGDEGDDAVFGGTEADRLSGGAGSDKLFGGTENDTLTGEADADTLQGNSGNDALIGGAGSDLLVGGLGDDGLFGGTEVDRLQGGAGNDTLNGGLGADQFIFDLANGTDRLVTFEQGSDRLNLRAFDVTLAEVKAAMQLSGGSILLDLADLGGTGTVLLVGQTSLAAFTASDFIL